MHLIQGLTVLIIVQHDLLIESSSQEPNRKTKPKQGYILRNQTDYHRFERKQDQTELTMPSTG